MIKVFMAFFAGVAVSQLGIGDTLPQNLILIASLVYVIGIIFCIAKVIYGNKR